MNEQESQTDRMVQALNALTLAVLSVRRQMAAGPIDPTREQFLRDEESLSRSMEVSARELLEFGNGELPEAKPSKSQWGEPRRSSGFVVEFPNRAAV